MAGTVTAVLDDVRARRTGPLVLELDLTRELVDAPPGDPVSALFAHRRGSLRETLDGLRRARADDRVRALVAKVGPPPGSLARAQELRDAVLAFREAGKKAVAWAESFGEFGRGTTSYYLATAFDEIWLQPSGDVGITGVAVQTPFLRGALDRAGITPEMGQRYEYKNAANALLEHDFTPAHREAAGRLAASIADQVVEGISAGRSLPAPRVRELIDGAPLLGTDAEAAGLLDRRGYRDEVYERVLAGAGEGAKLLFAHRYARLARRPSPGDVARNVTHRSSPVVALIHGAGGIRLGRSARSPLGMAMGSDTVCAAFRAAVKDERVKAIVFRVDSPGGSYVASDAIWRQVVLARRSGRPVVISMGGVAASGGYFVSMAADVIVAEPATLTGSIGVLGGKQVADRLLRRVGISLGQVAEGENALILSPGRGFTPAQWDRLNAFLDHVYDDFTAKVAEGRGLSRAEVHEIARGRVWTGADARERSLVDELGGLERAVEIARERASLPADPEPALRVYPRPTPMDRVRPPDSSEDAAAAAVGGLSGLVDPAAWGPFQALAAAAGLPAAGPLAMHPLVLSG